MTFKSTRLDKEKKKDNTELLTFRFSLKDREELNILKEILNIDYNEYGGDAKAVKIAIGTAKNVIPLMSGATYGVKVFKKKRKKYD